MKKLTALLMVIILCFSMAACSKGNGLTTVAGTTAAENPKFIQFENGLNAKGLNFKKTVKSASLFGAIEGYGYKFDDGAAVELYRFDKNSDAYKSAVQTGKLYLKAMHIYYSDIVINDDMILWYYGTKTEKSTVDTVFSGIK